MEPDTLPQQILILLQFLLAGVSVDWNIMNPGFHGFVVEFGPFVANVKDQRTAEEQVLVSERCGNSPKIEQILVSAMRFQGNLFRGFGIESVLFGFPGLIFRVRSIEQRRFLP